jgi:exodeoxyribonuclease VII large subunit
MPKETLQPDFFPTSSAEKERRVYTVSQITQDIKLILENTFGRVWVEGEVSNVRPSAAGHLYFSLKDETALLNAIVFSRARQEIKFKVEDGIKVICFGNIEVYGPHGKYQLIVEKAEPKGLGGQQLALEQLKKKLEKEGFFAVGRKRPIPYLPARIAVVTSLQGAAIKDILKVLERRFRDVQIIIRPVRVQGEGAKEEIAQAIKELNAYNQTATIAERIEVMIVGRGGGSAEDLWAFNEEIVARAIYGSKIPVISAVGHERDISIADLVADLRAATPSVAAEMVIPRKEDLRERLEEIVQHLRGALENTADGFAGVLEDSGHRLSLALDHILEISAAKFTTAQKKLQLLSPLLSLGRCQEKISNLAKQVYLGLGHLLELKEAGLAKAARSLSSLSPLNILGRGYSITFRLASGEVIKDASLAQPGELLRTRLHKGELISQVKSEKAV